MKRRRFDSHASSTARSICSSRQADTRLRGAALADRRCRASSDSRPGSDSPSPRSSGSSDELAASFTERIAAADSDLRRTLGAFVAEAEAERAALAERLAELSRRVDEATRAPAVLTLSRLTTRAGNVSCSTNTRPMTDATELIDRHSERAKVESWRLHVLIEAGYPLPLAEKLAAALDADLHEAVELVGQGCDPRTAAEILL